jgi:putative FmdB family regulatory protein
MPIYEYECQSCNHVLDALQKMSDEPLKHCPSCGEPQLRKLMSAPRFRLKGSGWYETDFKDKNRRNIAGGDSSESSDKAKDKPKDKTEDKTPSTKKDAATSSGKSADKPASKKSTD